MRTHHELIRSTSINQLSQLVGFTNSIITMSDSIIEKAKAHGYKVDNDGRPIISFTLEHPWEQVVAV